MLNLGYTILRKNMKKQHKATKPAHVAIFGTVFLLGIIFIFYKLAESVVLNPENMIIHTNVVYYDGKFSATSKVEDTKTALYVLNQSDEVIYATVFEYDRRGKEIKTAVQITPQQNQFIKTEGPGVVYLINQDGTSSSTIKFSRWYSWNRYY